MPHHDPFEYDVAISYAGEDRALADELTNLLMNRGMKVFQDEYRPEAAAAWKDMVDHLVNLYARKAQYCLLLISEHYPLTAWTESERTEARERSFREAERYILPILLDDKAIPGLGASNAWDLRQHAREEIVDVVERKLMETKSRSGPPAQSHDLRSGNVPSEREKPDGSA